MTRDRKKGSGKAAAKKPRVKKETVKDLDPKAKGDVKGGQAHTDLCAPGHLLNPPPDLRRTA